MESGARGGGEIEKRGRREGRKIKRGGEKVERGKRDKRRRGILSETLEISFFL